jgi:hypothetical protein
VSGRVPDTAGECGRGAERRVALVAVGSLDRRASTAAEFAREIAPDLIVAVHVAVEPVAARVLGTV